MYELLGPDTKVQRFDCTFFFALHYILSVGIVLCVSLELCPLAIVLQYYTGVDANRLRFMGSVAGR